MGLMLAEQDCLPRTDSEKALALVWQESDRRFLAARLQELK